MISLISLIGGLAWLSHYSLFTIHYSGMTEAFFLDWMNFFGRFRWQ
jgi:hypothetical protein